MTLLGIELSDAGILAAAGNPPRLLPVDGGERESPGFALSTEGRLIVGKEALSRARFNPRAYTNRFWDELSTESIKQPGLEGNTKAELAYLHLLPVWDILKKSGDEVVITVPGSYTEQHLGLLLGIAIMHYPYPSKVPPPRAPISSTIGLSPARITLVRCRQAGRPAANDDDGLDFGLWILDFRLTHYWTNSNSVAPLPSIDKRSPVSRRYNPIAARGIFYSPPAGKGCTSSMTSPGRQSEVG